MTFCPLCTSTLSVLICGALFVVQLGVLYISIACESNFLLSCRSSSILHVILSMLNTSIPGIPYTAGPSSGTTKNLHLTHLSLCLYFTVHMTNCIFNMTKLFFVVQNTSFVEFQNKIVNTLYGIRLPLHLVSILYVIQVHLWLVLDSNEYD